MRKGPGRYSIVPNQLKPISVKLPKKLYEFIRRQVEEGFYANISDFVRFSCELNARKLLEEQKT